MFRAKLPIFTKITGKRFMKFNQKYLQGIEWLKTVAVSFFAALFAWSLIQFLTGLTMLYFSYDLNIGAKLTLSGIDFLSPLHDPVWTRDAIISVYLSGPFMNFGLGISFFIAYTFIPRKTQSFSFFMLWVMVFSFTRMFATFAENAIQHTGVYRVSQLMHIGDVPLIVSVVVALYFLYLTGLSIGKLIMLSINPKHIYEDHMKTNYFLFAFVIPWLLVFGFWFNETRFNLHIIYLLGIVVLIPFLWSKGPENRGFKLMTQPSFLGIDVIATLLFILGSLLLREFMASGIVLT